jgi:hypothetical protein
MEALIALLSKCCKFQIVAPLGINAAILPRTSAALRQIVRSEFEAGFLRRVRWRQRALLTQLGRSACPASGWLTQSGGAYSSEDFDAGAVGLRRSGAREDGRAPQQSPSR